MAIYKVINEENLNETKSEAIADLKNRVRLSDYKSKKNDVIYAKGKNSKKGYDALSDKLAKLREPMRTAQDYKDREEFYSTSNKMQDKDDIRKSKDRAFAKRPILGALQRKINRKIDDEYKGTDYHRDRKHDYGNIGKRVLRNETFDMCADYVVGCLEGSVDEFDLDLFTEASAFIIDCLDEDNE